MPELKNSNSSIEIKNISIGSLFKSISRLSVGSSLFIFGAIITGLAAAFAIGGGLNQECSISTRMLSSYAVYTNAKIEHLLSNQEDPEKQLEYDNSMKRFISELERIEKLDGYKAIYNKGYDFGSVKLGCNSGNLLYNTTLSLPFDLTNLANGGKPGNVSPHQY